MRSSSFLLRTLFSTGGVAFVGKSELTFKKPIAEAVEGALDGEC